ncbi:hypothetical protein TRFO_24018 [Tritrichomonas foetus]|uniref:RRM domain-containing protein n=1 Tax=Tritrichomonas foetus TaxID=1144522 RepID=A0A1J4K948_9EUKA|nr:hypothetical protein TRFO_24018 [Tritrichomonas foetus]|eukprot:OHT07739.1 hypothetical protein TRFO_24018 [Tritrichomonas foetus]
MDEQVEGVHFSPMFDSPPEMQAYFDRNGFDDYVHFAVFDNYCSITFSTPKRDVEFYKFMNGRTINDEEISARLIYPDYRSSRPKVISPSPGRRDISPNLSPNISSSMPPNIPSNLPMMNSRTIAVKSPVFLSDRQLYEAFKHCGFIRQVESRATCGYLQFDTENDTLNAVEKMDGALINDIKISVTQIADRMLNVPNVVIPLAITEKEEPPPPPPPPLPPPPPRPKERDHSNERKSRDFDGPPKRERHKESHRKRNNNEEKREYTKPRAWERERVREYERGLDKL